VSVGAGPVAAGRFGNRNTTTNPMPPVDLVLAANAAPQLLLLDGDGHSNFTPGDPVTVANAIGGFADLATADLNGDGDLDIVASNPDGDRIVVVLGDGHSGLHEGPAAPAGQSPGRVVVQDVNGDGIPDAMIADETGITVLAGNGDGSFAPLSRVEIGNRPTDIAVLDVTGDGRPDLLAAVPQQNVVRLFAGNGTGQFAAGQKLGSNQPMALALGDFTGDGYADLLVANAGDQTLVLRRGTANGFAAGITVATGMPAQRLVRADLNGDGRADVVALDATGGRLQILLGDGGGGFQVSVVDEIGTPTAGLAVADFNGDRLPDVALSIPQEVVIGTNISPVVVRPGDVDRNGVVTANDLDPLRAEFFDGDGDDAASAAGGAVTSGAEADVNGDGIISAADVTALLQRLVEEQ
jgi:hypothetical protein